MKKILVLLLALCMMFPMMASAEVFFDKHPPVDWEEKDIFEITVYKTGTSDAILLQNGEKSMLIDGGASRYNDQLHAALLAKKITKLTYMFNTSPRAEHLEGLIALLKRLYIPEEFLSSVGLTYDKDTQKTLAKLINETKIPYRQVEHEETLDLGGVKLTFFRWYSGNSAAARAAIVHAQFGDSTIMFLSDLSTTGQRYHSGTINLTMQDVDIVSAPNHGKDVFLNKFIDNLTPEYVFVTNYNNDAVKNITKQLTRRNIKIGYAGSGTIHMATDGTDWYIYQNMKEF